VHGDTVEYLNVRSASRVLLQLQSVYEGWKDPLDQSLANGGNLTEMRYFTPQSRVRKLEKHQLRPENHEVTGHEASNFRDGIVKAHDRTIDPVSCGTF